MADVFKSGLMVYGIWFVAFAIIALVLIGYLIVLRENRSLKAELTHLATTDPLTGISNRRFFEENLAREVKRAQRYGRELSLLMIDLDNFRNYNNSLGHSAGDQLLRDCAHLMKALLRASDLVARYGADEFAVLLPEISAEQGRAVADKLRKIKIGALSSNQEITLSIGCAAFQQKMTAVNLLELAERDLLKQKPKSNSI